MIIVTGATGHLGSSVVDQLLKVGGNESFIVTSSNDKGVANLKAKGLNARLANFNDTATLKDTFKDIDKLLLISTMDHNRFKQHKNVIDAVKYKVLNI